MILFKQALCNASLFHWGTKSISFSDSVMNLLQWLHSGSQQKWKWNPAWNDFNCLSWRNCDYFSLKALCSSMNLVVIVWIPLLWRFVPGRKKIIAVVQAHRRLSFPAPCPHSRVSALPDAPVPAPGCASPRGRSRWRPSPWNAPFSQRQRGSAPEALPTKRERRGINNKNKGSSGISEVRLGIRTVTLLESRWSRKGCDCCS